MDKQIDWDAVDAEFDAHLKKVAQIDKQIKEERKKVKTIDELVEDTKYVNKVIEKNNFKAVYLTPKSELKSDNDGE